MTTFDFRDPAFRDDRHAYLARLREEAPVQADGFGNLYVLRHAEVSPLLRDGRLGKDLRRWEGYDFLRPYGAGSTLERYVEQWMLSREPPDHTRLRNLAMQAFTPRAVAAMQVAIEETADELMEALPAEGPVELMGAFAQPFPVRVIARILGLPPGDESALRTWSDGVAMAVELGLSQRKKALADQATVQLVEYLGGHIEERRRRSHPGDDLLSAMVVAESEGGRLGHEELMAMLLLLFVAGHETTTHLIGNGLLALLQAPDQLARLRASPLMMPLAVEELLRFDGPVGFSGRAVHEALEIQGTQVRPGQMVILCLASANRDPRAFGAPDRLDLGRTPNPHVAFGGGIHYCLGATLARLEAQIAFDRLLRRWPSIALAGPPPGWRSHSNLRGLEKLPLCVGAGPVCQEGGAKIAQAASA
jgi:cytochrome P450